MSRTADPADRRPSTADGWTAVDAVGRESPRPLDGPGDRSPPVPVPVPVDGPRPDHAGGGP